MLLEDEKNKQRVTSSMQRTMQDQNLKLPDIMKSNDEIHALKRSIRLYDVARNPDVPDEINKIAKT